MNTLIHTSVGEDELAARATAPRVTEGDVEAAIASEWYFTAMDGVQGVDPNATVFGGPDDAPEVPETLALLTLCVLVLQNGIKVVGESACVSAANFDAAIGQQLARKDAVRKVWPLLGMELASRLASRPSLKP